MSELPRESSVPEMRRANGVRRVLRVAVCGRSLAQEAREGPMAEAARPTAWVPDPALRRIPVSAPGLLSMPGLHQQLSFREYLENCPLIPVRLLRDFEERRRLFVEGCRAREAAFDANPPQMDFDAAAFTLALTTAEAISPLAD
ncbi:PREDICTED: EP300-interacting inhibitor of differentiation 2B [Propithecus coquereli]|uniref:EP300-interacting inhibitor of differentiation 2B n=1 Tax=Propithecus coquereli TaxID=379532 RepID=UPI00063F3CA4|nr:PREDICTED: EP300-interacting inhibitor of differentiation 2B [Propithecus coquereli]